MYLNGFNTFLMLLALIFSQPLFAIADLPIAKKNISEVLIDHKYFQISYNEKHLLANWVYYELDSKHLTKGRVSQAKYPADTVLEENDIPYLPTNAFNQSGFDHGHLAPAADFKWSETSKSATYVMTNIVPQTQNLNRGAWKHLEEKVRKWACKEKQLKIVVGPVLKKNLKKLPVGASIPEYFFKVILDDTSPRKAIAFLYSQDDTKDDYQENVRSVSEMEKITGFDFFPELTAEESKIESSVDLNEWQDGKCN